MQVTVAHINATAKNAADDKLRQSLRRFANTHTAPATVVLVSSSIDVGDSYLHEFIVRRDEKKLSLESHYTFCPHPIDSS